MYVHICAHMHVCVYRYAYNNNNQENSVMNLRSYQLEREDCWEGMEGEQ